MMVTFWSHFPHKGAKRRQLLAGGLGLRYINIGENSLFFYISLHVVYDVRIRIQIQIHLPFKLERLTYVYMYMYLV